jgi:predicted transcriptional regulator
MEVPLTPEQEAQLARIARDEGIAPAQLVREAVLWLIEADARFRAAVQKGIEQADGGLFVEEPVVDANWLPEMPVTQIREASHKLCPVCGHRFKGKGWDGIDAHWRSKHEATMPYERAWPLIRSGRFGFRALPRAGVRID